MNKTIVNRFLRKFISNKRKINSQDQVETLRWLGHQDEKTWQGVIELQAWLIETHREEFEKEFGEEHHAELLYVMLILSIPITQSFIEVRRHLEATGTDIFGESEKAIVPIWLQQHSTEQRNPKQQKEYDYAMLVLSVPHLWWAGLERELSTLAYEELDRIGRLRRQL